jgi:hypothetical protein
LTSVLKKRSSAPQGLCDEHSLLRHHVILARVIPLTYIGRLLACIYRRIRPSSSMPIMVSAESPAKERILCRVKRQFSSRSPSTDASTTRFTGHPVRDCELRLSPGRREPVNEVLTNFVKRNFVTRADSGGQNFKTGFLCFALSETSEAACSK